MKLSLVVLVPGSTSGKTIPIARSPFVIGRDAKCQLRPSSALVSNRHCSIEVKANRVFAADLGSTNGTFVNGTRLEGEHELKNNDQLNVGPLAFSVRLEASVSVDQPTPLPPTKSPVPSHEEDIAAVLLATDHDESESSTSVNFDSTGVPTGGTEILRTQAIEIPREMQMQGAEAAQPAAEKKDDKKKPQGNTSSAADEILKKYLRRPRK